MTKFFTAEEGSWRVSRESRKEPAMLAISLSLSKILKIGTWNIRKTFESGRTAQVAREMHLYNCRIYNQEMHHLMVEAVRSTATKEMQMAWPYATQTT